MEMLNRAIGDADAFTKMLEKVSRTNGQVVTRGVPVSREVEAWNAEVERKRAEKKARKAQHTKALDGLR